MMIRFEARLDNRRTLCYSGVMPICECHGKDMWWHTDKRKKKGGYWICRVRKASSQANWRKAHPEIKRANQKTYQTSAKGYWTRRKYVLEGLREKYLIQLEELRKCQIS